MKLLKYISIYAFNFINAVI